MYCKLFGVKLKYKAIPWIISAYSFAFGAYESYRVLKIVQKFPDTSISIINDETLPHLYRISCLLITLGLILGDVLSQKLSVSLWWIFAVLYAIRDCSELLTLVYTQTERRNVDFWLALTINLISCLAVVGEYH